MTYSVNEMSTPQVGWAEDLHGELRTLSDLAALVEHTLENASRTDIPEAALRGASASAGYVSRRLMAYRDVLTPVREEPPVST